MTKQEKIHKQAGAELCQAQEKLELYYPALPSKKLWSPSIKKDSEVLFHLTTKLSSICQEIDVVFHLPWGGLLD